MMKRELAYFVIASAARQSMMSWIAASLTLLAMTAFPAARQVP
jgi:hypothetical protein